MRLSIRAVVCLDTQYTAPRWPYRHHMAPGKSYLQKESACYHYTIMDLQSFHTLFFVYLSGKKKIKLNLYVLCYYINENIHFLCANTESIVYNSI